MCPRSAQIALAFCSLCMHLHQKVSAYIKQPVTGLESKPSTVLIQYCLNQNCLNSLSLSGMRYKSVLDLIEANILN